MTPTQLGSLKAGLENHLARLSRGGEQFFWWPEFRLTQARLVKAALGRIAEGTYGCCRQCHVTIGLERLRAVPHALFCITCQEDAARYREFRPQTEIAAARCKVDSDESLS
jgi:Prokaryotic dksA/traR C4-type zinc finger